MTSRAVGGALLAAVIWVAAGCNAPAGNHEDVPLVFVSVPPQAWLVEQLAGAHFRVETLLPSGRDPHTYEPEPRQIMALGGAALYFRIGVPLETRVLQKIAATAASVRMVDTTAGIAHMESGDTHDHGHADSDPHVWLGPAQLRVIAEHMTQAFTAADPANAEDYTRRLGDLLKRLDSVDAAAKARLAPHKGAAFFVYHPAFGYFAAAYGLEQNAVETGGREPTPKDLERLIAEARGAGVRVIFVQPQFPVHSAETVAKAIGGAVAPLDPMAPDILNNLTHMAETIASALENPS